MIPSCDKITITAHFMQQPVVSQERTNRTWLKFKKEQNFTRSTTYWPRSFNPFAVKDVVINKQTIINNKNRDLHFAK